WMDMWEIVQGIVLVLHFIGLAMLIGGALHQLPEKVKNVTRTMRDGAYTQLVTGIALVGLIYANDGEPDNAKIGVKFAIALAIAVIGIVFRKRTDGAAGAWATMLGLAIANVAIAVFW